MGNRFSKGDRVKYVGNTNGRYVEPMMIGHTGIVVSHFAPNNVDVEWERDAPCFGGVLPDNLKLLEPTEAPKPTKRYYVVCEIDTGHPLTLEEAKERAKEYAGTDVVEWIVVEAVSKFVTKTTVTVEEAPIA